MNVEQAAAAVAYLTSMTTGWNDDATEQLVYEFERLDDPAALMDTVAEIARSWTWSGRPPLGVILAGYTARVEQTADRSRRLAEANMARCDGSGWLTVGDSFTPCLTCNPATARVFADPADRLHWRHGVPTWRVLGYEQPADLAVLERVRCPVPFDRDDPVVDSRVGARIALAAYRAVHGRDPSPVQQAWLDAARLPARPARTPVYDDVF